MLFKKVEWEVRIVNAWDYRCQWLAYQMMTNKFTREEEADNKRHNVKI